MVPCSLFFPHNKHCFVFTDNKVEMLRFIESHDNLFDIAYVSVDVYFFSSGCLVTYMYLRTKTNERLNKPIDCRKKLTELFIYIIKRFFRYVFRWLNLRRRQKKQYNTHNKINALMSKIRG